MTVDGPAAPVEQMLRLSNATIGRLHKSIQRPGYDRDRIGVGIVHLGAGAFFRAHSAVYTDDALAKSAGDWGICAVSLRSLTIKDELAAQDGLYTLMVMDDSARIRVIGSIKEVLAGEGDIAVAILRMADSNIRLITLTITEKGYCLNGAGELDIEHPAIAVDLATPDTPKTAIGVLVAALQKRFAASAASIAIVSCDNVSANGSKLRNAVVSFARALDPQLADWIASSVAFPNTMVDSITPASDDELTFEVAERLGTLDKAAVRREAYSDWVIEEFNGPRPAWELAGAVFTDNVSQYENAKLRLVNAPHSALAYLGLLANYTTVADAMSDDLFVKYFLSLTDKELIPSLQRNDALDFARYRDRIGSRFANRSIQHRLQQIAADGSAKLPQRLIPPLIENLEANRPVGDILTAISAWMLYVSVTIRTAAVLDDPLSGAFSQLLPAEVGDATADVRCFLSVEAIFPPRMTDDVRVCLPTIAAYESLSSQGVRATLTAALPTC